MRKILLTMGMLASVLAFGTGTAHAQMRSLDDAILHVTTELSANIGAGTSIAVVSMYAGTPTMSNYLINEMIDTFVRIGRFTVVDRAQLELTARELDFSMSGEVDDLTAQMAGRRIGAQTIVTGAFEPHGADFRIRARIIQVEGAIIQGASNSGVPRNDPIALSLLGPGAPHIPAPAPGPAPARAREPSEAPRFSLGGGVGFDGGGVGSASGDWDDGWDWGLFSEDIGFNGFGAWIFADFRFVELSVGLFGGSTSFDWTWDDGWDVGSGTESGSFFALDIGLLGKFPIAVGGGRHFIFPAFGIGYTAVLSVDEEGYEFDNPGDFSTFRIMGGVGFDFGLTETVFLRTSLLGTYRFAANIFEEWFGTGINTSGAFGVKVRVGIGFSL